MICRKPGKTFSLFLGRGGGYEGIWLEDLKVESNLRKRDQFLEYLRKYLTTSYVIEISQSEDDRIIYLKYGKNKKENVFAFFYLGRKLYFAHQYYDLKIKDFITYKSWDSEKSDEDIYSIFNEIKKDIQIDREKENNLISLKEILEIEKNSLIRIINKKSKKLQKKQSLIKNDLEKMRSYKDLYNFCNECEDLSKLNKKTVIGKIKMNFKEKEHFKRRNELFEKAKRLKANIGLMEQRLSDVELELKKHTQKDVFQNDLKTIKPMIARKKLDKTAQKKTHNEYKIIERDNVLMAKGLSASGNDQMRKEWASKEDLWFHVDGSKSAHIIVKKHDLSIDVLCEVVAREFSKDIGSDEINLIYTQVKNLKGVKGIKGMVNYKKEKHIRIKF